MTFDHFIGLDVKFFNYCFVLWTKIYIGWTLLFNTTIFIWVMSGLHFLTYDKIFNWKNIYLYNWMYFVWSMPINFEPYSKKADLLTHLLHFVGNWTVQCVRRHWYHSNLDNSKLRNPIQKEKWAEEYEAHIQHSHIFNKQQDYPTDKHNYAKS